MKIEDLYEQIRDEKPSVLYISGKTCVGKSTFANKIRDELGYEVIELDKIVLDSVITPQDIVDEGSAFVEIYKNSEKRELIDPFVSATKQLIEAKSAQHQPIVIDGGVANVDTLAEIFDNSVDSTFIYFHPKNLDIYQRNLTDRFMLSDKKFNSGLPQGFWKFVDNKDFETFCIERVLSPALIRSIEQYARSSQEESKKRLSNFQEKFTKISVVEI